MTNTYEGYNFVNEADPPTNLTQWVAELFPVIDSVTIQSIVQQYEDDPSLPDVLSQAIAIMGECMYHHCSNEYSDDYNYLSAIFICPTYPLMEAFGDKAYKVYPPVAVTRAKREWTLIVSH